MRLPVLVLFFALALSQVLCINALMNQQSASGSAVPSPSSGEAASPSSSPSLAPQLGKPDNSSSTLKAQNHALEISMGVLCIGLLAGVVQICRYYMCKPAQPQLPSQKTASYTVRSPRRDILNQLDHAAERSHSVEDIESSDQELDAMTDQPPLLQSGQDGILMQALKMSRDGKYLF